EHSRNGRRQLGMARRPRQADTQAREQAALAHRNLRPHFPLNMKSNLFHRLTILARNLRWAWHPDTQRLFAAMDPLLWRATNHHPLKTVRLLSLARREALTRDPRFGEHLARCERELKDY